VAYAVVFREDARLALGRLDGGVQRRVRAVIDRLADNPRPGQATQIVGDTETWRVRAGDWRILYQINDDKLIVLVLEMGHRSTVYGH
jgi:mRNA interferase RelE/StbE